MTEQDPVWPLLVATVVLLAALTIYVAYRIYTRGLFPYLGRPVAQEDAALPDTA